MKKQYMLVLTPVAGIAVANAQSSYSTIRYKNKMQPAMVLELPSTTCDAEAIILLKLKQTGADPETQGHLFWKKNKLDGFYDFSNVSLFALNDLKLDMYFKVVQKNNEQKDNSTLYMMISKGNEHFVSPGDDPALWDSCRDFLNSFAE